MRIRRMRIILLAVILIASYPVSTFAMEAPGSGGANWYYSQKNHHWYYYDEGRIVHTGWLFYEGDWYWFDSEGWMEANGPANIDGTQYYFFGNGRMAQNQYIGLKYYNQDGQYQESGDIRVIGDEKPDQEDRDMITDSLYEVPREWFAQFEKDGWQMMFYKKKSYFAAPNTDLGIYYVHHKLDTRYKKVKFTDTDALLQGFGEYVGYASGCYDKGNPQMEILWSEQMVLNHILNIPDYYSGDVQFYFGRLFAAYLDVESRKSMEEMAPRVCQVMGDILHSKDAFPEYYERQKAREEAERQAEVEKQVALGGPGIEKQ